MSLQYFSIKQKYLNYEATGTKYTDVDRAVKGHGHMAWVD